MFLKIFVVVEKEKLFLILKNSFKTNNLSLLNVSVYKKVKRD
ncbi:hypothetical protein X278_04485 [Oenococcus oeni IOEB_0205]|nr:hypothetical protein X278_04485 [Oenococcus oeni IOEB_0205]SYW11933.1 conserved hypothetical protein [Oenococcus oeni]SYW15798.1 conserved hypothetical protein [Oenococcus oeni]